MLESPYLVDFGYSRPAEARTYARYPQASDSTTIYQHPDRLQMKSTKLHDLYHFGIVMLELATWRVAKDHLELDAGWCRPRHQKDQ